MMDSEDLPGKKLTELPDRKKEKAELRKRILRERDALSQEQRRIWDGLIFEKLVQYDAEHPCSVYLCYVNVRSEVRTKEWILRCFEKGKAVFVPKVCDAGGDIGKGRNLRRADMEFYRITAWEELRAGCLGILEPEALPERAFFRWFAGIKKDRQVSPAGNSSDRTAETAICCGQEQGHLPVGADGEVPRIRMLLPGMVFDQMGNRIGYGGGFYDRYLAKLNEISAGFDGKLEKIGLAYSMQLVETLPAEHDDEKVDFVLTEK